MNEMWIGNVFACRHEAIELTLAIDGQAEGAALNATMASLIQDEGE